jgi:hypothetical protein
MAETSENKDFSSSQKKGYSDLKSFRVSSYVDNRRAISKGMGNNRSGRRHQDAYECQLMPKTDM